jgi:transcriptional regulator with XRE-family HTH domain
MAERGLTDQKLAEAVGVHPGTIASWRLGRNFPRGPQLMAICQALKCSLDELVGVAKPARHPAVRMAKKLFAEVTMGGALDSQALHAIASGFHRMSGGKITRMEVLFRRMAEVVYEVELLSRCESSPLEVYRQLQLFDEKQE